MVTKPESAPQSLIHSITSDTSKDVFKEISENILDTTTESILQSDFLTKLPVIGIISAVANGVLIFRDRLFISKIAAFLFETSKATTSEKQKFRLQLENDRKLANKVGEITLDLIDKVIGDEKASMLGKVFLAHMKGIVTLDQAISLCEIIERTYIQDLINLKDDIHTNDANLEAVGIIKPIRHEDIEKPLKSLFKHVSKSIENIRFDGGSSTVRIPTKALEVSRSGYTELGTLLQRILNIP